MYYSVQTTSEFFAANPHRSTITVVVVYQESFLGSNDSLSSSSLCTVSTVQVFCTTKFPDLCVKETNKEMCKKSVRKSVSAMCKIPKNRKHQESCIFLRFPKIRKCLFVCSSLEPIILSYLHIKAILIPTIK